jgi:putative chitinase
MEITLAQLSAIMPYATERASVFLAPLNAAMAEFSINTPLRIAAFLAQVGHESGQLRYVREIASGDAYEGRRDLGNTHPGWGRLYKGRGLIQVTGYFNYCVMEAALKIPCTAHPELLEQPDNACRSAAYFWTSHGLNTLADQGTEAAFLTITKRINGGTNGWDDRLALYTKAKGVLKCSTN